MKNKRGMKTVHWILLAAALISVIIGFVICVKAQLKPSELIPSITGFFTLATTIVLDGIGSKKEKGSSKNIAEDIESGGNVTTGDNNNNPNGSSSGSTENVARRIKAKGDVTTGNNNYNRK